MVKGLDHASWLHFRLQLLSLDLPRSTESFLVVVKGPQGMRTHQDAHKSSKGVEEVLETHHQTVPECFWQTLTHLEMSLAGLL